jgi:hypothetical protein
MKCEASDELTTSTFLMPTGILVDPLEHALDPERSTSI